MLAAEYWIAPPTKAIVPEEPSASAEPRATVPPASTVPPVWLFAPVSVSVPSPDFRRPPAPDIAPA